MSSTVGSSGQNIIYGTCPNDYSRCPNCREVIKKGEYVGAYKRRLAHKVCIEKREGVIAPESAETVRNELDVKICYYCNTIVPIEGYIYSPHFADLTDGKVWWHKGCREATQQIAINQIFCISIGVVFIACGLFFGVYHPEKCDF